VPILEFVCEACQGRFEKFTRSINAAVTDSGCPTCGSSDTRRKMSAFGFAGVVSRTAGQGVPNTAPGPHGAT
jgi:putative FmdB family regulatory protein